MNGCKNEWLWAFFIFLVAIIIIIFIFNLKMSEQTETKEVVVLDEQTEKLPDPGIIFPRPRCSRMVRRHNKRMRCRNVISYGSEFCFVHKHIVEAEKTLEKIKALKDEQHVFNATEYEWKTCEECLKFLKDLNVKEPEKYVPRATCKNCKLFFRMVEHPAHPIFEPNIPLLDIPDENKTTI
jgi:hypothetical protein